VERLAIISAAGHELATSRMHWKDICYLGYSRPRRTD